MGNRCLRHRARTRNWFLGGKCRMQQITVITTCSSVSCLRLVCVWHPTSISNSSSHKLIGSASSIVCKPLSLRPRCFHWAGCRPLLLEYHESLRRYLGTQLHFVSASCAHEHWESDVFPAADLGFQHVYVDQMCSFFSFMGFSQLPTRADGPIK